MSGILTMEIEGKKYYITKDHVFKFATDKRHEYYNEQKERVVIYSFFVAIPNIL